MNLKKIGKVFTSKFVGTGPSSYKKNLQGRGLTKAEKHCCRAQPFLFIVNTLSFVRKNIIFIFVHDHKV